MRNIDTKAIEIDRLIRKYLIFKDYKEIDLVGVFYHELMIYATNFHIISTCNEEYTQKIKFPFINSNYVKNTPKITFKKKAKRKKSYKIKTIELIQFFLPLKKKLAIEENLTNDLKFFLLRNILRYKFNFLTNVNINLKDANLQLDNLIKLTSEIANLLKIKNKKNFVENFIRYVESYIDNEFFECDSYALLVGSNARLNVRINSANFLSKGKKVISFGHGEQSIYILDEPIVGYGDLSYCTDYVAYGENQDFNKLEYAKPLFQLPNIYYRNSSEIGKYYKGNMVLNTKLDRATKILYIPTLLSSNQRYAPFRDIDDSSYKEWQTSLLKLDLNITYKAHPKNKIELDLKPVQIERRYLQEVISEYDFYLLDYISTASALCVATNKPILYFNIGCRNLSHEALQLFKKRVFWVDIDLDKSFDVQIENALKDYNFSSREYINEFTEKYSHNIKNKEVTTTLDELLVGH